MPGILFLTAEAAEGHVSFFESIIEVIAPELIGLLELIGILVLVIGAAMSLVQCVKSYIGKEENPAGLILGKNLALGLEFLMAGEIIKTITARNLDEIALLAGIIVLRTALALLVHFEVKSEEQHK